LCPASAEDPEDPLEDFEHIEDSLTAVSYYCMIKCWNNAKVVPKQSFKGYYMQI